MNDSEMNREQLAMLTLDHYENNAQSFFEGTRNHDVSQNYREFLSPFAIDTEIDILDFGCGPGRDLKYFSELGHRAVGLDGSFEFCQMARKYSGCEVLHQPFTDLDLPDNAFDGVFANASLFHVQKPNLQEVLTKLFHALRRDGVLFMSNPRGNDESWSGTRYGNYMEFDETRDYLDQAGFEVLKHYYRPEGKPLHEQPWLAVVSRKQSAAT